MHGKSNKKIIRPIVGNIYLIWKKKRKQNLVWRDNVCSINVCQFKVLMCVWGWMAADNFSGMHFTQADRLEYAETRDHIILSSSEIFMNRIVTLYNESICHFAGVPLCWGTSTNRISAGTDLPAHGERLQRRSRGTRWIAFASEVATRIWTGALAMKIW